MITSSNRSALFFHRRRPGHRRDQKQDFSCPLSILSSAMLSVVAGTKYRCCNGFYLTVTKRGHHGWPKKGCWGCLTTTVSATVYTCDVAVACQRHNCGTDFASPAHRHNSSKEDCVGLAMLQDVQTVKWPRTYFCPHCQARGAGELETS